MLDCIIFIGGLQQCNVFFWDMYGHVKAQQQLLEIPEELDALKAEKKEFSEERYESSSEKEVVTDALNETVSI